MPTIPLYNNGAVPANRTGVMVPAVAQNVTAGPAGGQALMQVGQLGAQVAAKMREADDTVGLLNAQGLMTQHAKEQQLFQEQNKDQNTWLPAWEERQGKLSEQLAKLNLSNSARKTLDTSFGYWSKGQGIDIQSQSFKASIGNAKQAVYNTATEAAQAGNSKGIDKALDLLPQDFTTPEERENIRLQFHGTALGVQRSQVKNNVAAALDNNQPETAKSWLDQGLKSGALTPDEHAAQMADVSHAHEVQNLVTIANDDPRRALELATAGEQAKRISGLERVRIVDTAQAKLNELRTNSLKDYTGQIQLGVADKNKLAGKILDDPNLEPVDKANLANFLDRGPVNDPVTYASLFAEAKSFDGKEGSPEYSRLLSRVDMTLKDDQKSSVIAALSDSVKAPKDGASKAKAAIYSQMSDDLRAGLFGPLHGVLANPDTKLSAKDRAEVDAIKAELTTPAEQARLKTEPTRAEYLEGKARETWWTRNHKSPASGESWTNHVIDDEAAKHAASERAWSAMASLEKWQADNPKATPQETRSYYDSLLVRQRAVSQIAPSMTSMPSVNGLQGAPSPVSILPPIDDVLKKYAPNSGK